MRHRPHVHSARRRVLARRPLGLAGVILGLLLLGCACSSAAVFGVVRSMQHHR